MEFLFAWLLVASVQAAATMSPGPAFVFTVRNALAYDRFTGVLTSLGLGLGVLAHVTLVILGIAVLISKSIYLLNFIKYAGAAYLVYIGIKSLFAKKPDIKVSTDIADQMPKKMSWYKAISQGFITNMLNPKAIVFFTAVLTQFIDASTPLAIQILYAVTCASIEFSWFCFVAVVLTNPSIKQHFMRFMHWIERICGGLMIALGLRLALTK